MTASRPGFTVRRAGVADLDAVVDLVVAVADEGRWIGTEQVDPAQRHDHLRTALADPLRGVFVAVAEATVIGQIVMTLQPYGVADMGMLVAASWRGRGVGSALLGAGIDWARSAGAHKVALGVWPHNAAALALYRKFGFEDEGLLRRHYRRRSGELWDAMLMGLVLDGDAAPDG